ncbi:pectin lyase-like protein, partial [Paraphaeosphaeria sporulosa]
QSIQAAINAANSGSSIFVKPGTYYEQLTITTSGISLIGSNAVLVPPNTRTSNTCTGLAGNDVNGLPTQAGICVSGSDIQLGPYPGQEHRKVLSVGHPIKDVLIKGFTIKGFTGQNIAFVGGKNCRATKNILVDGANYGFLTVGSENTAADNNVVTSEAAPLNFIGMCMDDQANPRVASNDISKYIIALCVQTNGARVEDNKVHDSCVGAFVDPGIMGAKVVRNHITSLNQACTFGLASGIMVNGAHNTLVKENYVEGQKLDGKGAGIVVVDDVPSGSVASGNVVVMNVLRDNDVDIFFKTTGNGNVFLKNTCETIVP